MPDVLAGDEDFGVEGVCRRAPTQRERLRKAVHAVTVLAPDLDDVAIAEVLWLAAVRQEAPFSAGEAAQSDASEPAGRPRDSSARPEVPDAQSAPSPPEEPVSDPAPDSSNAPTTATREIYENIAGSPRGAVVSGLSFATPRGSTLPRSLELGRALRPFKRAWAPGPRHVLDIAATARDYARSGELLPTLRARPERFLDLALVVDRSPSMAVWQEVAEEFATVLNRLGAFKRVRTWDLTMDGDGQPSLRAKSAARNPARDAAPNSARSSARADARTWPASGPRSQIIVLSDCSAEGWYRSAVWRLLHQWGAAVPTTLVNPLPSRLWRLTGLDLPAVRVTNPGTAAVRNTRLDYRRPWHLRFGADAEVPLTPLPVAMLTPYGLESWARVLMSAGAVGGAGLVGCDAVLVPRQGRFEDFLDDYGDEYADGDGDAGGYADRDAGGNRDLGGAGPLSAEELVDAFLGSASTSAARLAVMCAPYSSMTMPLLHLVRQTMVPEASLEDVAEVVVSGLFTTSSASDDSPVLHPRPGVRDGLEGLLGTEDTWRMYGALTQYIAARAGSLSALSAAIRDPGGNVGLPAELRPFAAATVDTLRVLGALPAAFAGTARSIVGGAGGGGIGGLGEGGEGGENGAVGGSGEPGEGLDRADPGGADTDSGKLIVFHAGAPQIGVSTVMASAAWILASHGKRVLVAELISELPNVGHYLRPFYEEPEGLTEEGLIPVRRIDWDFPDGGGLDYLPDTISARDVPAAYSLEYDGLITTLRQALLTDYDYVLVFFGDQILAADAGAALARVADVVVACYPSGGRSQASEEFVRAADTEASARILPVPIGISTVTGETLLAGSYHARHLFQHLPNHMSRADAARYWESWEDITIRYERTSLLDNIPAVFIKTPDDRVGLLAGIENLVGWITGGAIRDLPPFSESERRQIATLYASHGRDDLLIDAGIPMSATGVGGDSVLYADLDMLGLQNFGDLLELFRTMTPETLDSARVWPRRQPSDRLRITIGADGAGRGVDLDLKGPAEGGMGPHGLIVGAAGSGKRELLRTLVTSLVMTHSPEVLNLALVGLTADRTFAGMADLPHLSALTSNLAEDSSLIDRMADALNGEVARRRDLLRQAGDYRSVRIYDQAREQGARLEPLPRLLVVVDEFTELLTGWPDLIELFTTIGRMGPDLGIHLLIASRSIEESRLRGFDTYLSYRIALRTSSEAQSRAVIRVPDAYRLPPVPGSAYLKTGDEPPVRFKAAYVSEPAFIEDLAGRLARISPPAHQIWLPPLDQSTTLDAILPLLDVDPERGLCPVGWNGLGRLTVPLALVDKPFEQRRDLLWADLSGTAGHMMVIGGRQSGKSTMLRTLISCLALTHTPEEVQFFVLNEGGRLASVAGLPHVSGYATQRDPQRVRRIIGELTSLLAERQELFAQAGIHTMGNFRARRAELDAYAEDGRIFGDVFLVIDDWDTMRDAYEQDERFEESIAALAPRCLAFGIHLVLTASRYSRVPVWLRDIIGTQLELRLGDPFDSEVDRRTAAKVPTSTPGRGLSPDRLHYLTALPRIDGDSDASTMAEGTADLVRRVSTAWPGPAVPRVRMLPTLISSEEVRALARRRADHSGTPFGLSEADLRPVFVDFHAEPHFVAFGDVESGKSGLLRTLAAGITADFTPDQAKIVLIDYRRSLLDSVGDAHLLAHCSYETSAAEVITSAVGELVRRQPGPDVTTDQLRNRSWWTGSDLFVLVDDYELVATEGRSNPLRPLLDLVPSARDIGLHLVIARSSKGAARGLYEPVLQRLRDLDTPGLVMSGDPGEGQLVGHVKASPQPPGRGLLVRRRARPAALVQVAWTPPVLEPRSPDYPSTPRA